MREKWKNSAFSALIVLLAILPQGTSDSESGELPYQSTAIVGGVASLPCNTTAPRPQNPPILVIWYKNGGGDPVYSYDLRGRGPEKARHWSDDHVLGKSRAMFFMAPVSSPSQESLLSVLKIRGILDSDRGLYRCRVDFKAAPTRNTKANLTVIVPPNPPVIVNEAGREATSQLGPYPEGATAQISCEVSGGRPKPLVRWFWSGLPLSSSSEVSSGSTVTSNVTLRELKRTDNGVLLTCQAQNNNVSTPVKHSVALRMNLPPTAVWITKKDQHLLAGNEVVFTCASTGASPRTKFSWFLSEDIITSTSKEHQPVNMSVLSFTPHKDDHGRVLTCRSENPDLENSAIQDSLLLKVHYVPIVSLQFGTILKPDSIKEGDDIYFECIVQARPPATSITWFHNGLELNDDIASGIIVSNRSLVLQRVTKKAAGLFACQATNAEGHSTSNQLQLNVKYSPYCGFDEPQIVGVALLENAELPCDVVSNPKKLVFHWSFNNSADGTPLTSFATNGSRSVLTFSPSSQQDYGTILCFANNAVGRQREPCQFHVIPAGRPDSVANCSQLNHSADTILVHCTPGFDGGLTQLFTIELRYLRTPNSQELLRNVTLSKPEFEVGHLESGLRYEAKIFASNRKGRSTPVTLRVSTLKRPEGKRMATISSSGGGQDVVVARDDEVRDSLTKMMTTKADSGMSSIFHNLGNFSIRTIAFLLVSSISIVLIISVSIGLICKVQCSTNHGQQHPSSPKIEREGAILSTNSTEKLIEATSSQNSLVLQRSSTATSASLVLNNEDESLINNDPDVILQQQHPQEMYQPPFYHHHHITSSASHGTLRPHCSTFVPGPLPQNNQSLTLSASMLPGSKTSSAENLLKQHQMQPAAGTQQQSGGLILQYRPINPQQQNFMHTFPRNQVQQQNLRTTASGIEPALPCCSGNSGRRKTVTFLETTIECHNHEVDDFPLPPPPPAHQNSSEEETSSMLMSPNSNDASNYVESRV